MRAGEMRSVIGGALCLVAAAGLAGCGTTTYGRTSEELPSHRMTGMEPSGTVSRVDETQQVIVLDNGRMYRVYGNDAVYVNGRPVGFRTVRPGSRVTIVNGTPVVYQNGQYVVVQPTPTTGAVAPGGVLTSPPAAVVTPPPPSTGATVVAAPPAAVAAAPSTLRMTGRVTDVDRREIRVRMDNGESFEFKPPAGMVFRKGDPVTIDMTVGGSPSALPR